jgi:signal transduction histidine kinase
MALAISNTVLKDNHIELINRIDYDTPIKISLVVGELIEVIINILNNAKDALVENKVSDPWVQLDLSADPTHVTIHIEDNAGGIPDEILDFVFDEYFTTKEKIQGTGLGLYMSKQIIETSLNGKLVVENTQNGAKFSITLPLRPKWKS